MKKNGFTLVELLDMLVVLGILMAVAVPNITGILRANKLNVVKSDAIKMMDTAKVKMSTEKKIEKPGVGECVVFALNYLNDSEDITQGPNGGNYLQFDSFVVVTKRTTATGQQYEYYVRLIEEVKGSKYFGINLVTRSKLAEENTDYITNIELDEANRLIGTKNADLEILPNVIDSSICRNDGILNYYPGHIFK